jgi:hypothetical protein
MAPTNHIHSIYAGALDDQVVRATMDSMVQGTNVFRLRRKAHGWTKRPSVSDSRVSWIKQWENATYLKRGRCSFDDCTLPAEVGGHVWIKKMGMFIVPLCKTCNDRANPDRMEQANGNHSFISSGTVVLKTPMMHGMGNANRCVADCSETRLCRDCSCNISTPTPSHTRCLRCEKTWQFSSQLFAPYLTFIEASE